MATPAEELQPNQANYNRRKSVRNPAPTKDGQANSWSSLQIIISLTVVLVKVGLWVLFYMILTHFNLGPPWFMLPPIYWLYIGLMNRLYHWFKRHLWGHAA